MGLLDKLLNKDVSLLTLDVDDEDIIAIADGELIDISTVNDPVFATKVMGGGVAFKYPGNKVVLCAPANGTLSVLFPTGHAFGVTMNNGVELLVHCGIDTVSANGDGFKVLSKKQGDNVKAGDPIIEVDLDKLSKKFDMTTMLIVTNTNDKEFNFVEAQTVKRGDSVIK